MGSTSPLLRGVGSDGGWSDRDWRHGGFNPAVGRGEGLKILPPPPLPDPGVVLAGAGLSRWGPARLQPCAVGAREEGLKFWAAPPPCSGGGGLAGATAASALRREWGRQSRSMGGERQRPGDYGHVGTTWGWCLCDWGEGRKWKGQALGMRGFAGSPERGLPFPLQPAGQKKKRNASLLTWPPGWPAGSAG